MSQKNSYRGIREPQNNSPVTFISPMGSGIQTAEFWPELPEEGYTSGSLFSILSAGNDTTPFTTFICMIVAS